MDVRHFKTKLIGSSHKAVAFARQDVSEELTEVFSYDVELNQSCDEWANPEDFRVYPEEHPLFYAGLAADEVVLLLCRDEYVPVWIDINVKAVVHGKTILNLKCAGRYSDRAELYYYQERGTAPFGVKGPVLPKAAEEDDGRFCRGGSPRQRLVGVFKPVVEWMLRHI